MSKTTLGIFLGAVAVLFFALMTNNALIAGGSGLVMLVGVIYSYVVAQRDWAREAETQSGAQG